MTADFVFCTFEIFICECLVMTMTKRTNSEIDSTTPPKVKKKKYTCKFNAAWSLQFRHVVKSDKGDQFALCVVCNSHFGISNGGRNDVQKHCKTKGHQDSERASASTQTLKTVFLPTKEDSLTKSVTKAEVLFAGFVAEHNLSFQVADHFSSLVPLMFPDSQIAKKFKCRSQKTRNIICNALAPTYNDKITELCKTERFSVMIDESNDRGSEKCVAILVRVLDRNLRRIVTGFLSVPVCNIGNAANLFACLEDVFLDRNLPWENLVGYASDNASVMVGKHNSVLSRIKEKQPSVYDLGGVCHVANTCLMYGLKKLPAAVEYLLVDVYFHFLHSSKRKEEFKEFQEFTDTEPAKLLKHCPTRWLSLDKCVKRTLQQLPALRSYFNSHGDVDKAVTKVHRCAGYLNDPLLEMVFHFLKYILDPLMEFNTLFQSDESMIGSLHQEMTRLLRKFLGKFVSTTAIKSVPSITNVDYNNPENQHPDDNLAVGMDTRTYLHEHPDLPPETVNAFFRQVRGFYIEVTEKMMNKFPFHDKTLKTLGFLNPESRSNVDTQSVVQLASSWKLKVPLASLEEEYTDYQLSTDAELPPFSTDTKLDSYWFGLSEVTLPNGKKRYPYLPEVAFAALSLPHSNASTERCFSTVRKVQSDYRDNLKNETLGCLLSVKLNSNCRCYEIDPSDKILKRAAKACTLYNSQVSEKS